MTAQIKKGFTLIELLIVIAILGVLAVVVLVAINPVQQLARTRDAGRMSTVAQLGHAFEAYYTAHNGTYPPDYATLQTTGELNVIPAVINNSLNGGVCTAEADGFASNGWCARVATAPDSFVVYAHLEADVNLNMTGGNVDCTGDAYAAYLSNAGKACIVCAIPAADDNDGVCAN